MEVADWLKRIVAEVKDCEERRRWPGDNTLPKAADAVLKSLGSPHDGNDTVLCLIALLIEEVASDVPGES